MGFSASAHGTDANFGASRDAPELHTGDVGNVAKCHGKNPTLLAKYPIVINLHKSDFFRIFVTEKEIVIRKFTIKTPRRWAKRQSIMRKMRFQENTIKDLGTLNRGQSMKYTATIILEYSDGSEMTFDVTMEGKEHDIIASLLMITRGTLMASIACKATCYKPDGFEVCSYVK